MENDPALPIATPSPQSLAVIAGGLVLAGTFLLAMGGAGSWFQPGVRLQFRTLDATGLQPGMAVKISGFPVGRVREIRLQPDAQVLVETAQRTGRVLQIGHIERFNPVMRELEKKLSRPRFIEAHRLSPFPNRSIDIGVVLDLMIHDLEIILHLVRSPIASIDAVGVAVLTANEDIANARLRFENGCVANVTASRISPERMRKLRVFQEDCYLSLDYQEQSGHVHWKEGMEIKRAAVEVEPGEPLRLELEAFVNSAAAGAAPAVSGQQGTAALGVALEITRMIRQTFR